MKGTQLDAPVANVLLLDRDPTSRRTVAKALEEAGHEVIAVATMSAATAALRDHQPAIVVADGVDRALATEIARTNTLLLVVSEIASEDARIAAFEAGADDYVLAPASMRELVLRVRALLRRRARTVEDNDVHEVGTLRIDRSALRVWIDGKPETLTNLEIRVLIYLAENIGRTITREALLENVWNDTSLSVRVVDTSIRRLRSKLGSARELLRTLRNVGYQLRGES